MSELPSGFVLDEPASAGAGDSGLPPGFVLDGAPPQAGAKKPFTLMDTWPVKTAKFLADTAGHVVDSVKSGVTLPHDVMTGEAKLPSSGAVPGSVPFGDPESAGLRVADMAALASPTSPAAASNLLAASPAVAASVAGENIGVNIPKAIASDSPIARFLGQVSSKMPGGGPMQQGVATSLEQLGGSVGRAAEMAGGTADAQAAGQGFRSAIEGSFKPAVKARVGEAYDRVGQLTDKNVTTPLDATQGAIADITARRMASGAEDPGKAVATVLGGATRPGGLTFEGVKDLRTRVGEMLDTGIFPEGMSQGELRRIYGALSDDLKSSALNAGGERAVAALEKANTLHKTVEGWKDQLGKVLGTDRSGEGVTAAILRTAGNGSTGDAKALAMARAAVPPDAWRDIASTAVSSLGKDRKGDFSPAIFLNQFNAMSERGRALLFNSVGSGDVLPFLKDIATVSKKFVDAGKLANSSGTAGHNATFTMLGGAAAGMLHGSMIEPVTAIGTVVGNNLLARVLASKSTAASAARWARAYDAVASNPAPRNIAVFQIAGRNLASTINGAFGSKIEGGDFAKATQSSAPLQLTVTPRQ